MENGLCPNIFLSQLIEIDKMKLLNFTVFCVLLSVLSIVEMNFADFVDPLSFVRQSLVK